jgi:hypothetical protein
MNYWGISFIVVWILVLVSGFLVLLMEERKEELDELDADRVIAEAQEEIDREHLAKLMSAGGSIRSEAKNITDLDEYRRKKATECSMR